MTIVWILIGVIGTVVAAAVYVRWLADNARLDDGAR